MSILLRKISVKSVALTTMLWMCVRPLQLPTEVMMDVTLRVARHHHSTCVYMVSPTAEQGQWKNGTSDKS